MKAFGTNEKLKQNLAKLKSWSVFLQNASHEVVAYCDFFLGVKSDTIATAHITFLPIWRHEQAREILREYV